MFCLECGQVLPVKTKTCKTCGWSVQEEEGGAGRHGVSDNQSSPFVVPQKTDPDYRAYVPPKVSGLAVTGLIISVFIGIIGLVMCLIAKNQIDNSEGKLAGGGIVTAGIVVACVNMVLGLLLAL